MKPIACYFGPAYSPPLYPCAACGDFRPARVQWRPRFFFWLRRSPLQLREGPFRPLVRVCRRHTVEKKHRLESPLIA